ncbi:nuclear transport factor 2 family protein [Herbiconiux ginsengi]|uniref:nuclear transport factor 2 family protein n=1 Tax=Herbiconiux ginsengi TaxID=381665 RepID=UPI001C317211|nr:nuclear transport factor 2 family protein [Herbiconiux ginsengi]
MIEIVGALAKRVQELEDRLAIAQLIASYGPAADAGLPHVVIQMFEANSPFDAAPGLRMEGHPDILAHLLAPEHKQLLANGAAHVLSAPFIQLDGDRATATAYSQVLYRDEANDGFRTWRISANRWEWHRTPDGWKVTGRVNRPLDGTPAARELFAEAFQPNAAGRPRPVI